MSSPAVALSPFKVAVGRRGTSLLRLELVSIHGQAHTASWFTPIKSSFNQDLVESLFFCLLLDKSRSWNHHRMNSICDLAAHCNSGHIANVFNTAVSTGSNKYLFNGDAFQFLSFFQSNVFQCSFHSVPSGFTISILQQWHISRHRSDILWAGPPRNCRCNILGINDNSVIVFSSVITFQGLPVCDSIVPCFSDWTHGSSLEVVVGDLIGCDDSGTCSRFNGHVGDTHSCFHT
mmetsp:Transcript_15937/g.29595  ORF Transcript_15937/g.29595 Transcript_15937/m.29595 type:complete len:233 (+) Transcript_15937:234-932(+)